MTTNEIDKLFKNDFKEEDLLKYSSNKTLSIEEFEKMSEESVEEYEALIEDIITNIMLQIEGDDKLYEYFTRKRNENIELYCLLLAHTQKHKDDIYKAIEEHDKLNLGNGDMENLIKTLDPQKAKEFLKRCNEWGFSSIDKANLIVATGNIEKYLESEILEELQLDSNSKRYLIEETGQIEKYLELDILEKLKLSSWDITRLVLATGKVNNYLSSESFKDFKLDSSYIVTLIKSTGEIETYLTPENLIRYNLSSSDITELIKETGNIEEYLLPGQTENSTLTIANIIKKSGNIEHYLTQQDVINKLSSEERIILIKETGNIREYLTKDKVKKLNLNASQIIALIKETGDDIKDYLTPEKVSELNQDIISLIRATGEIEKYLTPDIVINFNLKSEQITSLIIQTWNIEAYLLPGQNRYSTLTITNIIKKTGEIEKYLTPEIVRDFNISSSEITLLLNELDNIVEYLFPGQKAYYTTLTIANIIKKTGNIEKYLTPEKIKEYKLSSSDISYLDFYNSIKKTGDIAKYLTPEKVKEFNLSSDDIVLLIKETGDIEKNLTPEIAELLNLSILNIIDLIKSTGNAEKYLTPENVKGFNLDGYQYYLKSLIMETGNIEEYLLSGQDENSAISIINIIKKTGNIERYLTPEKVKEFDFSSEDIKLLIKETGNLEEYLLTGQDEYSTFSIANIIKKTGEIEKYLTLEKVRELNLSSSDINLLIKEIGKIKEYLLPGQDEKDVLNINNIYYKEHKDKFTEEIFETLEKLFQKNSSLYSTINFEVLFDTNILKICNEEQLIRITNYPNVQEYILRNNNFFMFEAIKYIMKKDENWIISFDKIIKRESKYKDLMDRLKEIDITATTEEFIENFLCIISDSENYFEIENYEDIVNYSNKKNEICLNILSSQLTDIPSKLQKYNENDLYKFALLEYKFGISLEEAKRIIRRYGTDSDKLPESVITDYIRVLKAILEHKNIKDVINYATNNNLLENAWIGFPNARNAEGKILNMFAELYNEKLYNLQTQDKLDTKENYIDPDGKQHQIDIYEIKGDFNLNVRVEGAYRRFKEPDDFSSYYENPDIDNHGNCESYIGNDLIAIARNYGKIIVGYNHIANNALASCGPYDLNTRNNSFSIYTENSDFRIPDEMKNNTRHPHNEMVKERLIIDENGNAVKNKPDYVIWIEETPKDKRNKEWKEQRENDSKWIMTKKAAAQLGIPIVIIDREYFAERENDKITLMKKLITGEEIDKKKYKEYFAEYNSLSKAELIEQLIIKFENNRVGLQFNNELNQKYFTQVQLEDLIQELYAALDQMVYSEKKECLHALKSALEEELIKEEKEGIV